MSKVRSTGIVIFLLSTVYVGAVVARANHLLFTTATGYVYHPLSDSLFEVTISPFALDRRDLFNPFANVLFYEIRHTEPLGTLSEVLASREADRRLRREDPSAWRAKRQAERHDQLQRLREQLVTGRERVDISFYSRPGSGLRTLPPILSGLRPYLSGDPPEIVLGDAVVVERKPGQQTGVQLLEGVVFVRGSRPARLVSNLIEFGRKREGA